MDTFKAYIGKSIELELSGKLRYEGILIDAGNDIIVLYTGLQFLYIPILNIQFIRPTASSDIEDIPQVPIDNYQESISYRKILNNARGVFLEIYISGNHSVHGYLTSIMNDYFVFYSPVHYTMFVSLNHLKYLVPYPPGQIPYSLDSQYFTIQPSQIPLARSFQQQIKKLEGKFTVFDVEGLPNKTGLLKKVEDNFVELITANGESVFWNMQHLKTAHCP